MSVSSSGNIFWKFLPFWLFMVFFKFGGGLHYSLLSPLGEKVLPIWLVGILVGSGSVIQLLLDVPAGHLLDRLGYKRLLKITTFIFLFAGICFMFGFNKQIYLISFIISTFGWLFFGPGVNAYVLSHSPKEKAGKFISIRDISGSVGIVFSSAVLPFVLVLPFQYIGMIIFILLFIALLSLYFSPKDIVSVNSEIKITTHHHYIKRNPLLKTIKSIKKLNPASTMLLLSGLSGSIFYGIIWFVVPMVIAHQASSGFLSIGLGIFDFSVVILGFVIGNLADKLNKRTLVFFGLLLFSISGMIIGFNFGWLFIIFGFLATTGDEIAGLSLWSWLHSLDRNHDQDGAISGVINLFSDLGWAIGPILAGILYTSVGPSWTIMIGALPIFVVWIFYQLMLKNYHYNIPNMFLVPKKPHKMRYKN